ncbi:MAG: ribosome silencing factor [Bacteroidetes bacterium]|nr:MAG: ribosome silencing factor [Bacteroidota bacterium]
MNSNAKLQEQNQSVDELHDLIIDSIHDIKGKEILKLDLRQLEESPTDYFIICEGTSNTQVKSIADNIQKRLKLEANIFPSHVEGTQRASWVCLDYFHTVIHVFYTETRGFYQLENLWSDASFTEYQAL